MKPIKTFRIGSCAFFDGMDGFEPKDVDELCIMDTFSFKGNSIQCRGLHGKDVFFFRNMSKDEFKKDVKASKLPMTVGKFLVPEFVDYLGFTIEDLKEFDEKFNELDEKHTYERVLYKSYIKNNGFFLTSSQREEAFKKYKESRYANN